MIEDRESRSSILHSRSSTPIKFATAAVVSAGFVSDFAVAVLVVAAVAPVAVADVVVAAVVPVAVADVVPLAADGPIVLLLLGAPRSVAASSGVAAVVALGHQNHSADTVVKVREPNVYHEWN
jgi:hypothetical protein